MRQVGTLSSKQQAQQFADYLVTQNIAAHTEQDSDSWAIWVRDEEQIQQAAVQFKDFCANPEDKRYEGVESRAEQIRHEQIQRRKTVANNVVEMRGNWRSGVARKAPATFLIIAACVLVGLVTGFSMSNSANPWIRALMFRDTMAQVDPNTGHAPKDVDTFENIKQGQIWRLVSPILLHANTWHLVFNMYWLWYFGRQIEHYRGTVRLLILVLLTAAIPNFAQAAILSPWFGGMSGVVYGLFGYVWMKSQFDPRSGMMVSQLQTMLFLIWFFACFFPFMGNIANSAHAGGLFVGVVTGYLPVMFPDLRKLL